MRVLLTGASGFLGKYVLRALGQQGIDVVTVARSKPDSSVDFIEADLLSIINFEALLKQSRATHLLHLAWYTEHGKYWTSPLNLRWQEATIRLVEAFCVAGGKQVVVAGTCAEYDWSLGYCRENSTPLIPSSLYGTAKDASRRLVMAVCNEYQTPCAWGRIFLPYGNGESSNRLIPSLIEVLQKQRAPFGINAQAFRDFLHASDVAEGFVKLLTANATGAYNICSGEPIRLAEIVRTLASQLEADPGPLLALSIERPGEPTVLCGENLLLKSLGWRPKLALANGLIQSLQGNKN